MRNLQLHLTLELGAVRRTNISRSFDYRNFWSEVTSTKLTLADFQHHAGYHEIRDAGDKGQGVFALRSITTRTGFLVDTPLFVVEKEMERISPKDVLSKVVSLTAESRKRFEALPYTNDTAHLSAEWKQVGRFKLSRQQIRGLSERWGCFVTVSQSIAIAVRLYCSILVAVTGTCMNHNRHNEHFQSSYLCLRPEAVDSKLFAKGRYSR